MDAMRNAMRELLKNAKANAFENPAHPCPCYKVFMTVWLFSYKKRGESLNVAFKCSPSYSPQNSECGKNLEYLSLAQVLTKEPFFSNDHWFFQTLMTVQAVHAKTMDFVKMVSILFHANVLLGLVESSAQVSNHSTRPDKWSLRPMKRPKLRHWLSPFFLPWLRLGKKIFHAKFQASGTAGTFVRMTMKFL